MKKDWAAACAAALLMSVACAESKAPAPPPSTAAVAPATTAPAATLAAASEFGVPECDNYMKSWLACVDSKVPESMRATYRTAIEQSKAQWKQAASTPQGKESLAMACTQSLAATKQALAAYNCSW
jgi:hypothetical protein